MYPKWWRRDFAGQIPLSRVQQKALAKRHIIIAIDEFIDAVDK